MKKQTINADLYERSPLVQFVVVVLMKKHSSRLPNIHNRDDYSA